MLGSDWERSERVERLVVLQLCSCEPSNRCRETYIRKFPISNISLSIVEIRTRKKHALDKSAISLRYPQIIYGMVVSRTRSVGRMIVNRLMAGGSVQLCPGKLVYMHVTRLISVKLSYCHQCNNKISRCLLLIVPW